jgi:DNA-binding transcriptional MerR regulator
LAGHNDRFDDDHHPAYTMGRAADLLGVTQAFLRSLGVAGLVEPHRSAGGHRRFTRHQLRLAARVRELLDDGMPLAAACRIVQLEDHLADAHERIAALGGDIPHQAGPTPAPALPDA